MEYTKINDEGLVLTYKVIVDSAELEKVINEGLVEKQKTATLPGFSRPGTVPLNYVKKRHGNEIITKSIEQIVTACNIELVEKEKLKVALPPEIDVKSFEEGVGLQYEVKFEIFPEVPNVDFSKISIDKYICDISEKDVQEALQKAATFMKESVDSDKEVAENGDIVIIDFVGKVDGVAFDRGSGNDFELTLGSNMFIPTFEEQIVGMKVGTQKVISVTFPEDYFEPTLAGKKADFDIYLKKIKTLTETDIDDELGKKFGFSGLDELKEKMKEQIRAESEKASKIISRKQLFDKLDEEIELQLPPTMVQTELKQILEGLNKEKDMESPLFKGKSEAEISEFYDKVAKRRVKLGILFADLSLKHDIKVTDEDVRNAVYEQMKVFPGMEDTIMQFYNNNPEAMNKLRAPITEDKLIEVLFQEISFKEVSVPLEELVKMTDVNDDKFFGNKALA